MLATVDRRPWLRSYGERPESVVLPYENALAMASATLRRRAKESLVHYFDASLTGEDLDRASDGLALGLAARGFGPGDRLVVQLQNDDQGMPLPPGEPGELVIDGPQVISGYWQQPEQTALALSDGRLRTGDIGLMDAHGWFYLVDRRKDLIVASGYKVWPREVEDILLEHPAVREAAVVGAPDSYRRETVHAYVSLQLGSSVAGDELIDFCRARMAAYKYPRKITVLEDLPKTPAGKILRRELRQRAIDETSE